jgi:hypothetical protein
MRGISFTVAALFGFAASANAATLTVQSDHATYNVGDTITLTIDGDAEGATAYGVYGRLLFDGSLVDNGTRSQELLGEGWTEAPLEASDFNSDSPPSHAETFDQIHFSENGGTLTAANPISTITLIAQAPGTVDVIWDTQTLDFFGITNAPGTSFQILSSPGACGGDLECCQEDLGTAEQDLASCEADLAAAEDDLAECQNNPAFADADGDGEHDATDACSGTLAGEAVDQAGCSLSQFCAGLQGPVPCNNGDWRNDEPVGNALDCKMRGFSCEAR